MSRHLLHFESPIKDAISRLRFAPNSDNLLISSWDSSLRLFDVERSSLRLDMCHEDVELLDCCFQDDLFAYAAAGDGSIYRYDLQSENCANMGTHSDSAIGIEFSQETGQLVTAGWDKQVMLWDFRTSEVLWRLCIDVESISVYGCHLFVASRSSVNTYDLRMLAIPVEARALSMGFQLRCIGASLNIEGFAVGSVDGRVALEFPYSSSSQGYAFRCHPKLKNGKNHHVAINDITFNPVMCGTFATGDHDGNVIGWDAQSRRRLFELPRYPNSIASISCNHTGQLLAVASSYTYKEGSEREESPQVFIEDLGNNKWNSTAG